MSKTKLLKFKEDGNRCGEKRICSRRVTETGSGYQRWETNHIYTTGASSLPNNCTDALNMKPRFSISVKSH